MAKELLAAKAQLKLAEAEVVCGGWDRRCVVFCGDWFEPLAMWNSCGCCDFLRVEVPNILTCSWRRVKIISKSVECKIGSCLYGKESIPLVAGYMENSVKTKSH